ncbi:hypothetical protein ACOMHN_024462 [Nucella lapillus]
MPGTLGVAVAVQYVVFLWIMVEGHHPKKETTNTTAAPINTTLSLDNSSHEVDGDTNGTWNWPNWASEDTDDDSNIFSNKGVLNAIIGGVVAVVMIAIYAARQDGAPGACRACRSQRRPAPWRWSPCPVCPQHSAGAAGRHSVPLPPPEGVLLRRTSHLKPNPLPRGNTERLTYQRTTPFKILVKIYRRMTVPILLMIYQRRSPVQVPVVMCQRKARGMMVVVVMPPRRILIQSLVMFPRKRAQQQPMTRLRLQIQAPPPIRRRHRETHHPKEVLTEPQ